MLVLRCSSDRVALAAESRAFYEATRWPSLLADVVSFVGPKIPFFFPALVGLFAAKSARVAPPKLIRAGKLALIGWKLARQGWSWWRRWQRQRALDARI